MRTVGAAPGVWRRRWKVPGDKSLSHRALIFAAMAEGRSYISGLSDGGDVVSTARCLRKLGARIVGGEVRGWGQKGPREPASALDCGNSGTGMRLLTGLVAAFPQLTILTGDRSLRQRPMARIVKPLSAMGATLMARDRDRLPPLVVRGGSLGRLKYDLPVASAQVKSCLLLAGMGAGVAVELTEPGPSRDHTERMMESLGVPLDYGRGYARLADGRTRFQGFEMEIPSDPSSAAFLVAAAVLSDGCEAILENVNLNPTRIGFFELLRRMGARVEWRPTGTVLGEPVGEIRAQGSSLHGITVEGDDIPRAIDEFPLLAVVASQAKGTTEVRQAEELRHKESDRIARVAEGLQALGGRIEERPDGFLVHGAGPLRGGRARCHHDHRLEMSWAVAALVSRGPVVLEGDGWAQTSFPTFWDFFPGRVC